MEGASAFRTLTAGIRFNKPKKNAAPAQPVASTSKSQIDPSSAAPAAIAPSATTGSTSSSSKKRKRKADDQPEGPEEQEQAIDSAALRKSLRIRCTGTDLPPLWPSFSHFPFPSSSSTQIIQNLSLHSVHSPTPIQTQACSIIHGRRDLLACAPTGSGKTLAFLLPLMLLALQEEEGGGEKAGREGPVAIVIEPTRELARQVYTEASRIRKGTDWKVAILGEGDDEEESEDVGEAHAPITDNDADLLITTPLKLIYALKANAISLTSVQQLVLDEADRLFELGFVEQTDSIIAACTSPKLHKAMFSATIPSGVEELARSTMSSDSIRIIIGGSDSATSTISQELVFAGNEDGKLLAMKNLIKQGGITPPALVFVQSIERARDLNEELRIAGVRSDVIHSERKKEERDEIVKLFAEAKIWVLVCTDVMSRGVDFRGVAVVINYDFPQSVQSYIHRIGRTGRAGRSGRALTLFTTADAPYLRSIVNVMRNSGCEVPEWMLSLKAPSQNDKKNLRKRPVKRKEVNKATGSMAPKKPKRGKGHKAGKSGKAHQKDE